MHSTRFLLRLFTRGRFKKFRSIFDNNRLFSIKIRYLYKTIDKHRTCDILSMFGVRLRFVSISIEKYYMLQKAVDGLDQYQCGGGGGEGGGGRGVGIGRVFYLLPTVRTFDQLCGLCNKFSLTLGNSFQCQKFQDLILHCNQKLQ